MFDDGVGTALGVGPPDDDLSGHPIGLSVGCVGGSSVSSLLLFVVVADDGDAAVGHADFCGAFDVAEGRFVANLSSVGLVGGTWASLGGELLPPFPALPGGTPPPFLDLVGTPQHRIGTSFIIAVFRIPVMHQI